MSQLYWITPPPPRRAEFMLWVRPRGGLRLLRSDLEQVAALASRGWWRTRRRREVVAKWIRGLREPER